VPADEHGRINIEKLGEINSNTILIIQAGNVNTGAFDPIGKLCDIAHENKAWVHVDGAFGLWAATSEKKRHLTEGIEKADSISADAHKTLNIPYDSGIIICQHRNQFLRSMHAKGDYLIYSNFRDGMNYTPEMSRRARIIELWAGLKFLGKSGVNKLVDHLCGVACHIAQDLKQIGYEILNQVVFNQILVFYKNSAKTEKILDILQNSGELWCGGSKWDEKSVIRISICSWATNEKDITRTIQVMANAKNEVDRIQ
jgi:glutamate/tyrosine decarboxylase-like PLP-dependent enzyme